MFPAPDADLMDDDQWADRLAHGTGEIDGAEPEDLEIADYLATGVPAEYAGVPAEALGLEAREITAEETEAAARAGAGLLGVISARRRGPGYSTQLHPGEYSGPMAGFAYGGLLDQAVPGGALAMLAEDAGRDVSAASDDEVVGLICVFDRLEAWAAGRKYAAAGEFIRRRPADGCETAETGGLPAMWGEFAATELAHSLAESRGTAETLLETAHALAAKLPRTKAALRAGQIRDDKARIIVRAVSELDPDEARAAEDLVLDRAGTLTPGGLRSAIARAVIEIAPDKARKRRETAARTRRVEVRPEESGNTQIAARELSPEVAASIDAELSARATELHRYGIGEDTQDRRVLAFLEKFGLAGDLPGNGGNAGNDGNGGGGTGSGGPAGGNGGTRAGGGVAVPGKVTLTATIETLAGLQERAGEVAGYGPADPDLTRRLAGAALAHQATEVRVIITDQHGQMTGFGQARPPTKAEREQLRRHGRDRPGRPDGTGPPGSAGTGFSFTPVPGPGQLNSGGYGTWLIEPGNGGPELIVTIKTVSTDPCDHRMQTAAHDPGTELRLVTNLRYGTCTGPVCRRPAAQSDWEHNVAHDADGRTCLCNGNPECRFDHRLKQANGWEVKQYPDGRIEWTAPTGRTATAEPYRYPT